MSPTVRHDSTPVDLDAARPHRAPRAARVYAFGLLGIGLAGIGGLLIGGSPRPQPGLLLVLAIPLAVCVNRFVFYPNESGVTAEAAVIVAAMVIFRGDAPWLGPLVVAALVGALDTKHWGGRAFVRMAYNSGSTVLVTSASVAVFLSLAEHERASSPELLGAVLLAALVYVVAESMLGITLFVLLGEPWRAATSHQLPLNAVAIPLAVLGTLAGLAELDVGWWCALLVLLPVSFVPELVLVARPRGRGSTVRTVRTVGVACAGGALVVGLALPEAEQTWLTLGAVALLTGVEGRVGQRLALSVLAVLTVAVVVVVPTTHERVVAAVLLIVVATVSSRWFGDGSRSRWSNALWCVPLASAAWLAARLWQESGEAGPFVFVAAMTAVLVVVAAWGSPPWGSRVLGPWSYRHLTRHRRALVATCSVASVLAVVTPMVGNSRSIAVLVGGVCAQADLAIALVATRQWRFAPRRRARDATLLVAASIVSIGLIGVWPSSPSTFGVIVLVAALAARVAWPLALGGDQREHVEPEHAP